MHSYQYSRSGRKFDVCHLRILNLWCGCHLKMAENYDDLSIKYTNSDFDDDVEIIHEKETGSSQTEHTHTQ